jgi:hypothetical protein
MASNTRNNFRTGAVKDRTQIYNPRIDRWIKRDNATGHFLAVKRDGVPFKGVAVAVSSRVLLFPAALSGRTLSCEADSDFPPAA